LVSENVKVMYTRKGLSDLVIYDLEKIFDKYELPPEKLIDMKGLMGDSSDNIPGVPGIGEKTAIKLLKQFDSIDEVLNNIDQVSGKKRKENLRKFSDQAKMSYRLAKIKRDVAVDLDFDKCRIDLYDDGEVVEHFKKLGFSSLLDRFEYKKELQPENINFIAVGEKELSELKQKALEKGEIALSLKIAEDSCARNGKIREIIYAFEDNNVYSYKVEADNIASVLKEVLESEKIAKLFINAKESSLALLCEGIEVKAIAFEPLLAYYLLQPSETLPELEEVYSRELELGMQEFDQEQILAVETSKLFKLRDKLIKKLKDDNLYDLFKNMELPLIKVLARMEYNGVKIDKDWLEKLSDKLEKRLD
ncbi:MAG: DNA polymerase I, partial [Halanaerobium sp. MSAO_Bac5]